jgi:hypothetical protein
MRIPLALPHDVSARQCICELVRVVGAVEQGAGVAAEQAGGGWAMASMDGPSASSSWRWVDLADGIGGGVAGTRRALPPALLAAGYGLQRIEHKARPGTALATGSVPDRRGIH